MITMNTLLGPKQIQLLILDRDGVININSSDPNSPLYYILKSEDFIFKDGVLEAFRRMNDLPCDICICTRQQGISKRLLTWESLNSIHSYMTSQIIFNGGAAIKGIFVEPILPAKTYVLLKALAELSCLPQHALLLDDGQENIIAAKENIGINGAHITDEYNLLRVISDIQGQKIIQLCLYE